MSNDKKDEGIQVNKFWLVFFILLAGFLYYLHKLRWIIMFTSLVGLGYWFFANYTLALNAWQSFTLIFGVGIVVCIIHDIKHKRPV